MAGSKKIDCVERIYRNLLKRFGRQGWWPLSAQAGRRGFDERGYSRGRPVSPKTADQKFEVCVGAILTQNTAWTNVEKAIKNLGKEGLLKFGTLHKADINMVKTCIKPAGYFNQKAKKLRAFTTHVQKNFGGDLDKFLEQDVGTLRKRLLSIWGIGDETADSIILYAANKPKFVVDAYTRRVFSRLGFIDDGATYSEVQEFFERNLPKNADLYKEYHALIVELSKTHCRSASECDNCAIEELCGYERRSIERLADDGKKFAGRTLERAIKAAVPPEVIKESSFIEGITDLAHLLQKSKKSGGRGGITLMVRDGATGLALSGAPVSMWSALFADGCKVVGRLFDVSDDSNMQDTAEYFYNLSDASKDFRRMWMSPPSKKLTEETMEKLDRLKTGASKSMQKTIDDLEGLVHAEPDQRVEHLVHDKLLTLADLKAEKTGFDKSVRKFLTHMDAKHARKAGRELELEIERKGHKIRSGNRRSVENLYSALEFATKEEFSAALDQEFNAGAHALKSGVREARDFVNETVKFAGSVAMMGARTGHMFGRHYWKQLRRFMR